MGRLWRRNRVVALLPTQRRIFVPLDGTPQGRTAVHTSIIEGRLGACATKKPESTESVDYTVGRQVPVNDQAERAGNENPSIPACTDNRTTPATKLA